MILTKLVIINIFNKISNQLDIITIKIILENKIIIYKMPENRQKLVELIEEFKNI